MNTNIIEGNPTKTFFIDMITRDISIKDAIIDLLDNSIDGANNINPLSYAGLYIDINITKEHFIVKDNCGGFSLDTAKKYAFRFGRPEDAKQTLGSVGRFGIGMKRALFKMGKNFSVESKTINDHFSVNVNVDEWKVQKSQLSENSIVDDWSFSYELIEEGNINENGTYISVTNLLPDVASLFDDEDFIMGLKSEIERLLNLSLEKGIKITINNEELSRKDLNIIYDDICKPYVFLGVKDDVNFKVIAGLGEVGFPSQSGWYIYCNDRLVVEADKSEITGWGTMSIPQWHINYVMFKGIVFINSKETFNLPLTTTKKGIDATSEIYKVILSRMREGMLSVFPFLKQIATSVESPNDYRRLLFEQSSKVSVVNLKADINTPQLTFVSPSIDREIIAVRDNLVRISYQMDKDRALLAKQHSGTRSYKELGEITFEYYMKMEDINDHE